MPSSERPYRLIVQPQHQQQQQRQRHHHHYQQQQQQQQQHAEKKYYRNMTAFDDPNDYLTTRKVEKRTKKNTEKRVQRRVVLSDGRVVLEAEPEVTRDTVDDHQKFEEREFDDDEGQRRFEEHDAVIVPRMTKTMPRKSRGHRRGQGQGQGHHHEVVDDSYRRTVNTRDVRENATTTKSVGNSMIGVVKKRDLRANRPLSEVIQFHHPHDEQEQDRLRRREEEKNRRRKARKETQSHDRGRSYFRDNNYDHYSLMAADRKAAAAAAAPRVVHRSRSRKKVVDTEDVHKVRRRAPDGKIYTETYRTEQHEVLDDRETPDPDPGAASQSSREEPTIKDRENFKHRKRDEFTEYYRTPRGDKSLRRARLVGRGAHNTAEEVEVERGRFDWDALSEKIRRERRLMRKQMGEAAAERMDALTKRPLNFHQEEKTRKKETGKWLERHFGSSSDDWSSLASSTLHHRNHLNNNNNVHRSQSFSSIPVRYKVVTNNNNNNNNNANNNDLGIGDEEHQRIKTTKTKERIVKTTTTTYDPPEVMQRSRITAQTKSDLIPSRPAKNKPMTVHSYFPSSQYRKYNSTLSLLPSPKLDYSLHGDSSLNGEKESVASQRHRNNRRIFGSTASLGRHLKTTSTTSPSTTKDNNNSSNSYKVPIHVQVERKTKPLYITEFKQEPLFPAASENNLLFQKKHQDHGAGFAQREEERYGYDRNYLGFRSLERSDFRHHHDNQQEDQYHSLHYPNHHQDLITDSSTTCSLQRNPKKANKKAKSAKFRSQSFLYKPRDAEEREYVYDREERKFVAAGGLRHGHSDLRLDRGFKQPHYGLGTGNHHHSKEIVREQRQLEPQRFKTIIFLSGH